MSKRFLPITVLICVALAALQIHAATYAISVDVASSAGPWNRFYEECVGTCHPITVLRSAMGRNIQPALTRAHAECGFRKIRSHGILTDGNIYSENNGTPVYNWTRVDSIYDALVALGMSAVVEFDGMPPALASGTGSIFCYQTTSSTGKWNDTPPNDYNKWRDLITAFVQHLEQRYGADAIRKNWSFEVWNEPDLFLQGGEPWEYEIMYDYAAEGVRLADSLCKVGGPAASNCHPDFIDRFISHVTSGTNYATGATGSKCDFMSYHCYPDGPKYYANGDSMASSTAAQNTYHKDMIDSILNKYNYKGEIYCTEWAPTYRAVAYHSDDESSGSFIAKTIGLLSSNNLTHYPLPTAYSWWCISDIFEENCVGTTWPTAYAGQYGLLVIGDNSIPGSWDVPKPSYNTFRLLHKMTDTRISLTGGTTGDGLNGVATLSADNNSLQVLLYDHVDGAVANSAQSDSVVLTVSNIPFAPGPVKVEYWLMDRTHSNGYRVWQSLGSPSRPTATQWTQIEAAADLSYAEPATTVTLTGKTFTKNFHSNIYSVGLINISSPSTTALHEPIKAEHLARPSVSIEGNSINVYLPDSRSKVLRIFDLQGRLLFAVNNAQQGHFRIDRGRLTKGSYVLADDNGVLPIAKPLVIAR